MIRQHFSMQELERFLTVRLNLSTSSVHLVTSRYGLFCKWLEKRNLSHNKESTDQFLYELRLSGLRNSSVNSYIFMLKALDKFYEDKGIPGGFTKGIENLVKNPRPIDILTPAEITLLMETVVPFGKMSKPHLDGQEVTDRLNRLYHTFTRFLATTGARYWEAAGLTVRYLDLGNGKVTFVDTKTKTNRSAWISEPLVSELLEIVAEKELDDFVFTNLQGNPLIPQNYGLYLSRACKIAKIKKRVHPHIFRHSFATQLIMSGVDVTLVASLLGHKDIQTTYQNYVHLADDSLKKATFRHPLVRRSVTPKMIIDMIKESIISYKIDSDSRFLYSLTEGTTSLTFKLSIK